MGRKHSHCTYCGNGFADGQPWPRRCGRCNHESYLNPLPVSVLLQPVEREAGLGLLLIRRNIPPHVGRLALPGGYIEFHETWQAAAARELYEEAGVRIDAHSVREFRVRSAGAGLILIFGLGTPIRESELPPFSENFEVSERVVVSGPTEMAFPLHGEAVRDYFAGVQRRARGQTVRRHPISGKP